jgi:uncharacterized protein YbjT (DUF2867 family)
MNIAMSGATGFVGGHLSRAFTEKGWKVVPLGRSDFRDEQVLLKKIGEADVVVNLAGRFDRRTMDGIVQEGPLRQQG